MIAEFSTNDARRPILLNQFEMEKERILMVRFYCRLLICCLSVVGAGCGGSSPSNTTTTVSNKDSQSIEKVEILDLQGHSVRLLESPPAIGLVLIFVRTDCPVGNRYAPTISKLASEFRPLGVDFALIYPSADESVSDVNEHLKEYSLELPAYRDNSHKLVTAVGATVMPEATVYDANRRLVYRGRINDLFVDFGKRRAKPQNEELRDVLTAITNHQTLEFTTTKAIGCYIE